MAHDRRTFIERGCVAAAVLLTAGCTRGDASEATLSVQDQSGEGETLTIERAEATEAFSLQVSYDGGEVATDTFEAESIQEDVEVALDPALEESTTVDVAVLDEEGEELASDSLEYDVETPPEATLAVEDQRGGGHSLTVDEASANVEYYVEASYGDERVSTDAFDAGTTQRDLDLEIFGVPGQAAPVDVAVRSTDTDEALASQTVQYEEIASLQFQSNSGQGDAITVGRAAATVDYYLEVQYSTVSLTTERFDGGTVQTNLTVNLQPGIETTRQVTVVVRDAETGDALTEQGAQYKYRGGVMNVDDQSGDGQSVLVTFVEADTDYYVAVRYGTEQSTSEVFTGGSVQRGLSVPLDPALEESRQLEVALHAANDDERLYDKTIRYTLG